MRDEKLLSDAEAFSVTHGYPKRAFGAFRDQYLRSLKRGIEWEFTIKDWWEWWQLDGRWENRGCGRDNYVMARFNDLGPYHPSNVYCATASQNGADLKWNLKHRAALAAWWSKRKAAGVASYGSRTPSLGNPVRIIVSFPPPAKSWLEREAESLGITVAELLRRIIDTVRNGK
jgi:hypothetical protein